MNINSIMELFIIFFYIYFLILLGIFIKPTFIISSILFIYCIFTTYNILILCNFLNKNKNIKYIITFLFSFIYSLFCVCGYILFHIIYHKYIKKYIIFKICLIISPILYLLNVKLGEFFFQCHEHHIIEWGINFFFKSFTVIINKIVKV